MLLPCPNCKKQIEVSYESRFFCPACKSVLLEMREGYSTDNSDNEIEVYDLAIVDLAIS